MRKMNEEEIKLLDGYKGDHGSLCDGKGNILEQWDNRILEPHKILMHNQLWELFNLKFEKECPLYKQINLINGFLEEKEASEIREKIKSLQNEYESRKNMIYGSSTCEEAHEAVHSDLK